MTNTTASEPRTSTDDPCGYPQRGACPNQASEYVRYPATDAGLTYDGEFHPATRGARVCTPCADVIPGLESRQPLTVHRATFQPLTDHGVHPDQMTGEGVLAAIIAEPESLPAWDTPTDLGSMGDDWPHKP